MESIFNAFVNRMIAIVQTETSGNFYAFMTLTLVEVERCSLKSFTFKLEF